MTDQPFSAMNLSPLSTLRSCVKWTVACSVNGYLRQATNHSPIKNRYQRIYCHHIRKTGGTSLHRAFFSLGRQSHEKLHEQLFRSVTYYTRSNGLTFVGHNKYLLEAGHYFYGFSHHPAHALSLPSNTYTIAILRDPAQRVISHYKMLRYLAQHEPSHSCLQKEGPWLGSSFGDFLDNIPQEHLLRQLYMFSKSYNVPQAVDALRACNHIFYTEQFSKGVDALSKELQLDLPLLHIRESSLEVEVSDRHKKQLHSLLEPEYRLMEQLQSAA